eukprot:CAMPEP_0114589912 /NCGR_PEP_ID=MMETSP0125-20121206/12256_1 /TAXON_ID=485358 ORGANISM="Aristerostoma sp., Strain ATCC 50986" /NCGR_SAMPLE_ID=MMETSP0125 /ASSEMBLY_ACC=CAM_ASM_000245 /LENGTH=151 /DNA_ID=CAMNT_0001787065 /DNA_START=191 /DNA_END=646 /DNA_ORIENTATION=+
MSTLRSPSLERSNTKGILKVRNAPSSLQNLSSNNTSSTNDSSGSSSYNSGVQSAKKSSKLTLLKPRYPKQKYFYSTNYNFEELVNNNLKMEILREHSSNFFMYDAFREKCLDQRQYNPKSFKMEQYQLFTQKVLDFSKKILSVYNIKYTII